MNTADNSVLEQFIINTTVIEPIQTIITKLENKEFRDCDVKWLNSKLYDYTRIAGETLNMMFSENVLINNEACLTNNNIKRFVDAFTTLLKYFKTF